MQAKPLNPKFLAYLERRQLDPEICLREGVYSCSRGPRTEDGKAGVPIPDPQGTILAYPYFDAHGVEVNTKFVAPNPRDRSEKIYSQRPGAPKIFYGLPVLSSPELYAETDPVPLVIVEGENDRLAVMTAGHPWVISVPDGGSPDVDQHGRPIPMKPDAELDPETDTKFKYIANCWDQIAAVKVIVLFTDLDGVGQRLKDELARRLGKVRCRAVSRPLEWEAVVDGRERDPITKEHVPIKRPCKDANEVLIHYGAEEVLRLIAEARPIPVSGLYTLDDFIDVERQLYSTGIRALDGLFELYDGAFVITSGIPQSGKSQLWNQIAFNMAINYGWRICMASFEADIKPDIIRQLRAFYLRKPYRVWTAADRRQADEFIREHFYFITRDPAGIDDFSATPEWLCDQYELASIRYGVKMGLTDPWNQLDHHRRPGEMRDEYTISRIKMIKDTGKRIGMVNVLVAHPDKAAGKAARDGNVMSLYDISDGAAWVNAAELGVIVHRPDMRGTMTEVYARKIKFRGTGRVGNTSLHFDNDQEQFDIQLRAYADGVDARVETDEGWKTGE